MKHKCADVIKAWADGLPIEYRSHNTFEASYNIWVDWIPCNSNDIPDWNNLNYEWRIKNKRTIFYKIALLKNTCSPGDFYLVANSPFACDFDRDITKRPGFVKWISDEIIVEI